MSPAEAGPLTLCSLGLSFQQQEQSESTHCPVTVALRLGGGEAVHAVGWGGIPWSERHSSCVKTPSLPSLCQLPHLSETLEHFQK